MLASITRNLSTNGKMRAGLLYRMKSPTRAQSLNGRSKTRSFCRNSRFPSKLWPIPYEFLWKKNRIALPLQLTVNAHTDFNGYCRTLAQLGHSPAMICCSSDYQKAAFPIVEATLNQMADFHFWKDLHLDAVI